jgi:hypothetical protein
VVTQGQLVAPHEHLRGSLNVGLDGRFAEYTGDVVRGHATRTGNCFTEIISHGFWNSIEPSTAMSG